MAKRSFFGAKVEPACSYCRIGAKSADGKMVLCPQKGVVAPYYACRKFDYDPLRRVPLRARSLPKHDPSEFEL